MAITIYTTKDGQLVKEVRKDETSAGLYIASLDYTTTVLATNDAAGKAHAFSAFYNDDTGKTFFLGGQGDSYETAHLLACALTDEGMSYNENDMMLYKVDNGRWSGNEYINIEPMCIDALTGEFITYKDAAYSVIDNTVYSTDEPEQYYDNSFEGAASMARRLVRDGLPRRLEIKFVHMAQ